MGGHLAAAQDLARTRFACCADRSGRRRDRRADRCQLVRLLSVVQPAGSVADVDVVGGVGGKRDGGDVMRDAGDVMRET